MTLNCHMSICIHKSRYCKTILPLDIEAVWPSGLERWCTCRGFESCRRHKLSFWKKNEFFAPYSVRTAQQIQCKWNQAWPFTCSYSYYRPQSWSSSPLLIVSPSAFGLELAYKLGVAKTTLMDVTRYFYILLYYYCIYFCEEHYYDLSALVGDWSCLYEEDYLQIFKCMSFL